MKALEYPKVFKVLLNGGYIVVAGKAYMVVTRTVAQVGHITERMFRELTEKEVIKRVPERDQRGNNYEYRYWGLKHETD